MSIYFAAVYEDTEAGGYFATVPDMDGCITQANTLEELEAMIRDAVFVWTDAAKEEGIEIPPARSHAEVLEDVQEEEGFSFLTMVALPNKVKRVRWNVSSTQLDLDIVSRVSEEMGMDRSECVVYSVKELAKARREA